MFDDLHPARVRTGLETFSRARVVHRDGELRVLVDRGAGVIQVALAARLVEARREGRQWLLDVTRASPEGVEHQAWEVYDQGGCGCGARLKNYPLNEVFV